MTASVQLLTILILAAIVIAAISPIVLLLLWVKDWVKGQIW
jgi:hypothetical protein